MEADYYYGEDYKSQRSDYTEETAIYSNSVNAAGRLAENGADGKQKGAGVR